jgi:hypothetical protein
VDCIHLISPSANHTGAASPIGKAKNLPTEERQGNQTFRLQERSQLYPHARQIRIKKTDTKCQSSVKETKKPIKAESFIPPGSALRRRRSKARFPGGGRVCGWIDRTLLRSILFKNGGVIKKIRPKKGLSRQESTVWRILTTCSSVPRALCTLRVALFAPPRSTSRGGIKPPSAGKHPVGKGAPYICLLLSREGVSAGSIMCEAFDRDIIMASARRGIDLGANLHLPQGLAIM